MVLVDKWLGGNQFELWSDAGLNPHLSVGQTGDTGRNAAATSVLNAGPACICTLRGTW